jgi:hypothetical protein
MESWIDGLASALGEDPLTAEESARLLGVARDVAHGVERKVTPLAAFVLGCAVGRDLAGGATRAHALARGLGLLEGVLPPASSEP